MVRMTYKIKDREKDIEFTFEGQEDEVLRLYYKIAGQTPKPLQQPFDITQANHKIRVDMPTDQEIEAFIKSRPDYEHDLHTVQREFFGKTFASRGTTTSMYHRTNRQLTMVRQKIEKEEGRKFKAQTIDRNFKRYKIEPLGKYQTTKSDISVTA